MFTLLFIVFNVFLSTDCDCIDGAYLSGKCYLPLFEGNFETAQIACETRNGQLPTIADALHNQFLLNLTFPTCSSSPTPVWLGIDPMGWNGLRGHWLDGSPVNYSNWQPGSPEQMCAVMDRSNNGTWVSVACTSKFLIVCQMPQTQTIVCPNFVTMYIGMKAYCYALIATNNGYTEARKQCHSFIAEVLIIHSAKENELAMQYFFRNILFLPNDQPVRLWLALKVGDTTWADGSPVDYTNFALGENNPPNYRKCVQLALHEFGTDIRGRWYAADCSEVSKVPATICVKKAFDTSL